MNKQYTFSLPSEVANIIDSLPKTEKSSYVAQAILNQEKEKARQKALDVISLLNPQSWNTKKDAVELVQETRTARAGNILSNAKNNDE
jgi:hypothetical protein